MMEYYLAFDVGGTTIKYGLVDTKLKIIEKNKVDTLHNTDGHILKMLKRISHEMIKKYRIIGIGVSTAGIVGKDGSIKYAGPTIPKYQGTKIKEELEKETNLPVNVVNDVDAALLGEKLAGAARKCTSVYCVALGTGIGGAYFEDNHLFHGFHGTGNSLGYTLYDIKSKTNYEQRASTISLEKSIKPLGIDVITLFENAKAGDKDANIIINDWALSVAQGLSNILLLLDPEILIIGGAVSKQGEYLKNILQKQLGLLLPANLCKTKLATAELGNDAQLYGGLYSILK
ncbi:ROK family protein [Lactobacillus sp. LL6]|uniref:ROK family protein n=1 Tax=Lactobacillus sp. LL6 TaxID=2596827 RepID=UPI0011872E30|nr:ROK family protein [Lactobacillus sp. LL6]TSO25451.1 ROK family protein [Lactobacillus sp. LL6]